MKGGPVGKLGCDSLLPGADRFSTRGPFPCRRPNRAARSARALGRSAGYRSLLASPACVSHIEAAANHLVTSSTLSEQVTHTAASFEVLKPACALSFPPRAQQRPWEEPARVPRAGVRF